MADPPQRKLSRSGCLPLICPRSPLQYLAGSVSPPNSVTTERRRPSPGSVAFASITGLATDGWNPVERPMLDSVGNEVVGDPPAGASRSCRPRSRPPRR